MKLSEPRQVLNPPGTDLQFESPKLPAINEFFARLRIYTQEIENQNRTGLPLESPAKILESMVSDLKKWYQAILAGEVQINENINMQDPDEPRLKFFDPEAFKKLEIDSYVQDYEEHQKKHPEIQQMPKAQFKVPENSEIGLLHSLYENQESFETQLKAFYAWQNKFGLFKNNLEWQVIKTKDQKRYFEEKDHNVQSVRLLCRQSIFPIKHLENPMFQSKAACQRFIKEKYNLSESEELDSD